MKTTVSCNDLGVKTYTIYDENNKIIIRTTCKKVAEGILNGR